MCLTPLTFLAWALLTQMQLIATLAFNMFENFAKMWIINNESLATNSIFQEKFYCIFQ